MIVRADNVTKKYERGRKGLVAVTPTNLTLESGKLNVISGRSGGGKTTLLNMLAGLLEPSEGDVFYDDTNIYSLSDEEISHFRNKNIGYVPQGMSAINSLTVLENILLPANIYSDEDKTERALALLEKFNMQGMKDSFPDELSGGELRRIAIARALINLPSVIYADEPTNDLDNENARSVFELLRDISRDGNTVVVVTHDQTAFDYADIVYAMNEGKIEINVQ